MSGATGPSRLVVLASGRGSNLQAIMDAIDAGKLPAEIACVIADRPEAKALERARARGIPAAMLDYRAIADRDLYHSLLADKLDELRPDLIVLAGYMRLMPADIVRRYRWKIVNIHPSLLPAFPGMRPHQQAIEYGVKVSGCTVHFVDEGVDTGPIIKQAVVPVRDDDTPETLAARILVEEHRIYPEAIRLVLEGKLRVEGRRVIGADHEAERIDACCR